MIPASHVERMVVGGLRLRRAVLSHVFLIV